MRVLLSAAQRCYSNASGLVSLIGSVVRAQLGVRQRFSAVRLVCCSPTPDTTSNWLNQFGGKLTKKQDPSKIDNRCSVLHMSTGKTDVVAFDHIHIRIALFGYNEREYKGDIFWRSRQMHNFGGQDGLR